MKKVIYYLKLNESQTRELIADAVADIGCGFADSIAYNIEFDYNKENELCARCVIRQGNEFDEEGDISERKISIKELVSEVEKLNINDIYLNFDCEILKRYIADETNKWKIKGSPHKKLKNSAVKFYGKFGSDFRCVLAASEEEITENHLQEIDVVSYFAKDLNSVRFEKYNVC